MYVAGSTRIQTPSAREQADSEAQSWGDMGEQDKTREIEAIDNINFISFWECMQHVESACESCVSTIEHLSLIG
jgi:hypothetical protein